MTNELDGKLLDDVWERWLEKDPVRMSIGYRYPKSVAFLATALAEG